MAVQDSARLKLVITGRVQGVFFRASARERAMGLGLCGYANNRTDGAVEIVAEGRRSSLDQLLAWARVGPSRARVDDVNVEWAEPTGEFTRFETR